MPRKSESLADVVDAAALGLEGPAPGVSAFAQAAAEAPPGELGAGVPSRGHSGSLPFSGALHREPSVGLEPGVGVSGPPRLKSALLARFGLGGGRSRQGSFSSGSVVGARTMDGPAAASSGSGGLSAGGAGAPAAGGTLLRGRWLSGLALGGGAERRGSLQRSATGSGAAPAAAPERLGSLGQGGGSAAGGGGAVRSRPGSLDVEGLEMLGWPGASALSPPHSGRTSQAGAMPSSASESPVRRPAGPEPASAGGAAGGSGSGGGAQGDPGPSPQRASRGLRLGFSSMGARGSRGSAAAAAAYAFEQRTTSVIQVGPCGGGRGEEARAGAGHAWVVNVREVRGWEQVVGRPWAHESRVC
jgi:hypothetical protein